MGGVSEIEVRLAVALHNCKAHERPVLEDCDRDFQAKGKLSPFQTNFLNTVYYRVYADLVRQGICKKRAFENPAASSRLRLIKGWFD